MADPGELPRLVLFATGGTISMRRDAEKGGAVPELTGEEILASVPGWEARARRGGARVRPLPRART